MRKIFASTLAGVTAAGAVLATAAPAQAERYRYYHRHHDNDDEVAAAVLGGVAGLALGAALSSGSRSRYYDNGYYSRSYPYRSGYDDRGYYDRDDYARPYAYGYSYRPRVCVDRDRVWDPYIGRRVTVERRYPC